MKLLPRLKKFKKKRKQQLQKKETDARDITEHSSQESLQCSDKYVDVANNTDEFYTNFKELIDGYKNDEDEFIDMSQPRDASYATKWTYDYDSFPPYQKIEIVETTRLGEDVSLTSTDTNKDKIGYRSMPTEVRGITLRQLRAILPLIKRRCEKENWTRPVYKDGKGETKKKEKVTFETATLYDINKYIIKPFTKSSQKSFVETLPSTKGTQPPRWFVSHYWGETFVHTMACLEQMVEDFEKSQIEEHRRRGGGMTEDTPIWICAFANNQHNLNSDIADDPADTSFAKAMKIAEFRVISILDVNNQVYTRLWCMYELYLTLFLSKKQGIDGVLGIYTYHEHIHGIKRKAVGLVEGGTTSTVFGTNGRQKHFPLERLLPILTVSIQNAKASRDKDRVNILNSLVGMTGAFNDAIRGAVFSSQATLNLIYETGDAKNWNSALSALEKSIVKKFEFDSMNLPKEAIHHLPSGLEKLNINGCLNGRVTMDALLDWLENKSTNLKKLQLSCMKIEGEVGGKECGERLATFLARDDCKIEEIALYYTTLVGSRNFNTWIECLKKNRSLRAVRFDGMAKFAAHYAEKVGESVQPNTTIDSKNGQFYWDGTTFPDATLSIEQEEALKQTVSKFEIYTDRVSLIEDFVVEEKGEIVLEKSTAGGENATSTWLCGAVSCF